MEPRPHERGKKRAAIADGRFDLSFNGATSSRTWKADPGSLGRVAGVASMEPRPHERGKRRPGRTLPRQRSLQWSHVLTNVESGGE